MSNEIFGYTGNRYFVNSADSRNMEQVMEIFPFARNDGSIGIDELDQIVKEGDGQYRIGDTIIMGSVSIRKYIENQGLPLRGSVYSERHAREIMNSMNILDVIPTKEGPPLIYAYESISAAYMANHFKAKGRRLRRF